MVDDKKVVEPKVTAQQFAEKYQKLCEETGFRLIITPVWIARDDGTFSMQLQTSVGQLPKQEK